MDKEIIKVIEKLDLTIGQYEESLQFISNMIDKKEKINWEHIKEKFNIPLHYDTLRKSSQTAYGGAFVAKYYKQKEEDKEVVSVEQAKAKYGAETSINKDGSRTSDKLIEMSEEQAKDVDYMLKAHGFDIVSWELVSVKNNIWNVYSKQDGVSTLYSSKITVKPLSEYKWNEEDVAKLFTNLQTDISKKTDIIPKQYENNGRLLVVPISDFHFGLVSDIFSNGNDYNLEIAEKLFFEVINDVLENNKGKKFEKVLFVAGNDATNSDNISSTTTHGTPQNDCALWFTIVERLTSILIKGIDLLTAIAPVDVLYVPSNHDMHTTFGIMQTIGAWYRLDENVSVDTSPLPRKYYQFGKNTLAYSHDMKVKEALKIVSTEAKDKWSNSNRIILMLGHLHQSMEYEKQGMLEILRLPTISGYSRWTSQKGYVQTERKNQAFIIDYDKGIKETQNTILDLY